MGGRAMVQSYAVVFIMMAAMVEALLSTKWLKWPVFAIMAVFSYVNIWFTYNAHAGQGLYDPNGMTKAYYWAVVGRFRVPEYTERFKDTDEYFKGTPKNKRLLFSEDFEEDSSASDIDPISGNRSLYFYPYRQYAPILTFAFTESEADCKNGIKSTFITNLNEDRLKPALGKVFGYVFIYFLVNVNFVLKGKRHQKGHQKGHQIWQR